jgi:broad specificity phosphatase PhoE
VLVRHGETVGESSIRYHGRTDVALSELGRAQMRAARAAIARMPEGLDFARIFTTPLVRAREGARLIAGDDAALVTLEEFTEVHFGLFEGLTAGEIQERYPEEFARWNDDRLAPSYAYPQGESRAAFAQRVGRGITRMFAIWPGAQASERRGASGEERALVVAHRGVIRAIAMRLAGTEPVVDLGSIQVLEFDGAWRAATLDMVGHLRGV